MSFIQTVAPEQASGEVLAMYRRQQAHFGYLPNYARAFSHRPEVMASWATLLATIRRHVEPRRFELVTLAAAQALGNTYCSLAHGKMLAELLGEDEARAIAAADGRDALTEAERAMMAFARQVARDASSVCQGDVDRLLALGFADEEIFDIVTVAAARAFFTKVLDGLGTEADVAYREMAPALREALTVGRAIAAAESDRRLTEHP
ncbi:carboxymuconolactone decarboxylase family protein [Halomonas sp. M4R5S39]|uniref:carboxymuconolactone decarboxylase family protein n=1 Tax=Halomonas kalidii TaxID=3043293 RepID=UPI0024A98861|nr:carboxymuconolactone decarboxylase family protein [Halomonas kalidii]MDI5985426.1 carboxymuconolactone decarboxylase family protein [Halomonas kalidii]